MEYKKVKSASKLVLTKSEELDNSILKTMATISNIVGSTLGPGGRQVLIERQEHGLPPIVTKDGVTVYRSLGFQDSTSQTIMEAAREASVRTVNEAGDGTSTSSVLSEAFVRNIKEFSDRNKNVSPQKVVRLIEEAFTKVFEPTIKKLSVKVDSTTDEGRKILEQVATISANGDRELAAVVMECFDIVGDEGNVTIAEVSGPSAYEVEKVEGYPIHMGYEESCHKFYAKFVNDTGNQRVLLDKPSYILYHGRIQDPQSLFPILKTVYEGVSAGKLSPNVVIAATGFSESVIGYLATAFAEPEAINAVPLLVPQSGFQNGQLDFLLDLAAQTGGTVLDPLNLSFTEAKMKHLGSSESFEMYRFRSTVVGQPPNEEELFLRVDQLKTNLERSESMLDTLDLQERLARLTGGIARLRVVGASNAETKEKRDRAEDAVCAVRGAIKHGVLPGGGWTLLHLANLIEDSGDDILRSTLVDALYEPFLRILENVGFTRDEAFDISEEISYWETDVKKVEVYDALEGKLVNAFEAGLLDSTPAVLEALRNAISVASLLGTLGGTVVFARDLEVERQEAASQMQFRRTLAEADHF